MNLKGKYKPVLTLNQLNYNVYKDNKKKEIDEKSEAQEKSIKDILYYINRDVASFN